MRFTAKGDGYIYTATSVTLIKSYPLGLFCSHHFFLTKFFSGLVDARSWTSAPLKNSVKKKWWGGLSGQQSPSIILLIGKEIISLLIGENDAFHAKKKFLQLLSKVASWFLLAFSTTFPGWNVVFHDDSVESFCHQELRRFVSLSKKDKVDMYPIINSQERNWFQGLTEVDFLLRFMSRRTRRRMPNCRKHNWWR